MILNTGREGICEVPIAQDLPFVCERPDRLLLVYVGLSTKESQQTVPFSWRLASVGPVNPTKQHTLWYPWAPTLDSRTSQVEAIRLRRVTEV